MKMFDAIAFAGGGNRCYWQGGFYEAVADRLALPPKLAVGVSAGAFACIYSLLGIGPRVRELVLAACGPHQKNFDFSGWRAGGPLCPVGPMYRALLDELIDAAALARLQQLTDLHIAVARLPFGLPPLLGAAIGIGAYQVEKHLFHPVHPRSGRWLGFRAEFIRVRDLAEPDGLRDTILASGCVPPFMPRVLVGGKPGFDGGLVDNVPVEPARARRGRRRPHPRAADANLSAGAQGAWPDLRPALPPDRGEAVRCDQPVGDPGRLRAGTPRWPSVCGGCVAPGRKAMHFAQCCTAA